MKESSKGDILSVITLKTKNNNFHVLSGLIVRNELLTNTATITVEFKSWIFAPTTTEAQSKHCYLLCRILIPASSPDALIAFSCAKYCCVYDGDVAPVCLPASRDIPRRTRNSISPKKKQSERLGTRLF